MRYGGSDPEIIVIMYVKAPITTAADDSFEYFFSIFFSEKLRPDVSREYSARQSIHVKHQAFFSLKDKNKKKNIYSVVCCNFYLAFPRYKPI